MDDKVPVDAIASQARLGMIQGDNTASMQPVIDNTPDGDPNNLSATAAYKSQINISWTDNSTNESGFAIERCSGSNCTNFEEVAQAGVNGKSFSNTGLSSRKTYTYRVRAFNSDGYSSYTNVIAETTPSN